MSEVFSSVQRSARAVLSSGELAAIRRHIRQLASHRHVVAFELRSDGPTFGVVPFRAFPSAWSRWPVAHDATGIGLCLPMDGAGHLGVAMDRSGGAMWFAVDDGEPWGGAPPACQLLDDACRIRLGLGTDPPDRSPDWYWLARWLTDVVDAAAAGSTPLLDVVSVASAHPGVAAEELSDLDMAGLSGFVVQRHREHVQIADWECIRLDARADPDHPFHDLAFALDVGAFSRWVSAASPPLSDLASALTGSCTQLGLRLLGAVIADMVLRQRMDG